MLGDLLGAGCGQWAAFHRDRPAEAQGTREYGPSPQLVSLAWRYISEWALLWGDAGDLSITGPYLKWRSVMSAARDTSFLSEL